MAAAADLPPGPPESPLRQAIRWVREPLTMLDDCSARYGDTFTIRPAGLGPTVMLSDPGAVKEVFTGDPEVLRSGEANAALAALLGRNSVLLLDGEQHLRERRLLLPPFHGERLRAYETVVRSVAERSIASWPPGSAFSVLPHMQAITLEVITRGVFGVKDDDRVDALARAITRLLNVLSQPRRVLALLVLKPHGPVVRAWRRWGPLMRRVNRLLFEEIRIRRADSGLGERNDILSLLLSVTDEDGKALDDEHVRDELVTLLTAGHDTTATALTWALVRLAREPEMLARIREEGEPYAEAVARETLRFHAVLPFSLRHVAAPIEVAGRSYPAGIRLATCIPLAHRRPDAYPSPDQFRPERFLDGAPGTYEWIPFGGGTRRCLGAGLALLEMRGVLSAVARAGRLHAASRGEEPTGRRGITFAPASGGRVVFTPH
jgi:cytochrome P450 family 135